MAVTQYIGARYIPMFYTASDNSNSWEAGVEYEPLTVVTYLNQSYTSKIPVPASIGNPADNPTYWILTGAYNAQVAQCISDVAAMDGRMDAIEEDAAKDAIVIGDSYAVWGGVNWVEQLTAMTRDKVGTWHDLSVTGTGFLTNPSWYSLLANASIADPEKVKYIVVAGGLNDAEHSNYSEANIRTAISDFVTLANNNYPNATVYIGYIGNDNDPSASGATVRNTSKQCYTYYKKYAIANNAVYMDGVEKIFFDYTKFTNDHKHPLESSDMGQLLGAGIYNAVFAGGVDTFYPLTAVLNTQNVNIFDSYDNGLYTLLFYGVYTVSGTFSLSTSAQNDLGMIRPNFYRPVANDEKFGGAVITARFAYNGNTITSQIKVWFNNDHLNFHFLDSSLVGLYGNNISAVTIPAGEQFSIPWTFN